MTDPNAPQSPEAAAPQGIDAELYAEVGRLRAEIEGLKPQGQSEGLMPGVAPVTLNTSQLQSLLQGWSGVDYHISQIVLIMLNDLGLVSGVTNTQIASTMLSGSQPTIISKGNTKLP